MIRASSLIGTHDVVLITLDALRYDVACETLDAGLTPNLARVLPGGRWERRHSPGNFTYAAHHAFFAGFLPTPSTPGKHPRLFASRFPGSETTADGTFIFDEPDIVSGLAARGYHTVCVGGVGFFNKQSALGAVLPAMFAESHWSPEIGVTSSISTQLQVEISLSVLESHPPERRVFTFLNVSAIHQPNCIFAPPAASDSKETMAAALTYVDRWMAPLFATIRRRSPALVIVCSDHGTAYGEEGFTGHRLAHPVIWDVPYAEFVLEAEG